MTESCNSFPGSHGDFNTRETVLSPDLRNGDKTLRDKSAENLLRWLAVSGKYKLGKWLNFLREQHQHTLETMFLRNGLCAGLL